MEDLPYQVLNKQGVCIMHAPEGCRYPRRIEKILLEDGYTIRLHGRKITKAEIRKEAK